MAPAEKVLEKEIDVLCRDDTAAGLPRYVYHIYFQRGRRGKGAHGIMTGQTRSGTFPERGPPDKNSHETNNGSAVPGEGPPPGRF